MSDTLEKKAPPEFSEGDMKSLKRKHGETSAFKIAWAAHNKHHGKTKKAEADEIPLTKTEEMEVKRLVTFHLNEKQYDPPGFKYQP